MSKIWSQEEEASRLHARFVRLKAEKGIGQAEFARDNHVPGGASMLSQHIKGRRPINLDAAIAYKNGFGCFIEEISPRIAQEVLNASNANQPSAAPLGVIAAVPARADPLANSLADKLADLGDMLAVFASEEVLNMAYMHCVMAVQQFKFELSQRENKRRDATLAAAPILKTEKRP